MTWALAVLIFLLGMLAGRQLERAGFKGFE